MQPSATYLIQPKRRLHGPTLNSKIFAVMKFDGSSNLARSLTKKKESDTF